MWGDVNKMQDSISVEYGKLEELFAQKTAQQAELEKPEDNRLLRRQSASVEVGTIVAVRMMMMMMVMMMVVMMI